MAESEDWNRLEAELDRISCCHDNNPFNCFSNSTMGSSHCPALGDILPGESTSVTEKEAGEGSSLMESEAGEGSSVTESEAGEGSSLMESEAGEGSSVMESEAGEGSSVKESEAGEGSSVTESEAGEGSSVTESEAGEGSSVMESEAGEGRSVMESEAGEGSSVIEREAGEGSSVIEREAGEGSSVMESEPGEGSSVTESEAVEGRSVMAQLFNWELDHILREVFLYLDPLSLKNSRLTCSQWDIFIRDRIWKNRKIKSVLRKRMWNEFLPNVRTIVSKGSITSMDTNDNLCIVGFTDGTGQVFNLRTGNLITNLDDRKWGVAYCSTQVCLSSNLICTCACGSDSRLHFRVTLWSRDDWKVLRTFDYSESVRFGLGNDSVFICASYETIRWKTCGDLQFLPIKKASLRMLSLDGDYLAAWDGKVLSVSHLSDPANLRTTVSWSFLSLATFLLSYPRLYIMDRDNLYIWNVPEDNCVRRIPHPHHHHHSGSWGAGGSGSLARPNRSVLGVVRGDHWVEVFQLEELHSEEVQDQRLWRRRVELDIPMSMYVGPVFMFNSSCLLGFARGGNKIYIHDFWPCQPNSLFGPTGPGKKKGRSSPRETVTN